MIILVIDVLGVRTGEQERHPPIGADPYRPDSRPITAKTMQSQPRQIHVLRSHGGVKSAEDETKPLRVRSLNTRSIAALEESPQSLVAK